MPASTKNKIKTKGTVKSRSIAGKTSGRKTSSGSKNAPSRKREMKSTAPVKEQVRLTFELPFDDPEHGIAPHNTIDTISTDINKILENIKPEAKPSRRILMDGGFNISRQVLARIASLAASEITGLTLPKANLLNRFVDQLRGRTDGIRVDVGTTEAAVDMDVRVEYGTQIPEISTRLRENVARRIHEMTGLRVVEVNIRVRDITPPAPQNTAE